MKLLSVDRSKPMGKLVGEYSDRSWWKGFTWGMAFGFTFCVCVFTSVEGSLFRH
jgi:hypothetical protein